VKQSFLLAFQDKPYINSAIFLSLLRLAVFK
jgi:hypothetical protein